MSSEDATRVLGAQEAILQVSLPDGTRLSHPVQPGETSIGRAAENDLVLNDNRVSRRHARLVSNAAGLRIEDLGSANGVVINGAKVPSAQLQDGDLVELGPCRLSVSLAGASEGTAVSSDPGNVTAARRAPRPRRPAPKRSRPAAGGGKTKRLIMVAGGAVLAMVVLIGGLSMLSAPPPPEEANTQGATQEQPAQPAAQQPAQPAAQRPAQPQQPAGQGAPTAQTAPPAQTGQAGQTGQTTPAAPAPQASGTQIPVPQGKNQQEMSQRYQEQGQTYYDAGRLPEAVAAWQQAATLDPNNQNARVKLKRAAQELKSRAETAFNRGMRNYQYLNYTQAIQEWLQVLHLVPDTNDPLHRKAKDYIEQARRKNQR